ncbi:acyl-CoA thioesterase [Pontixanthobacter aquaemixtae]|uniref:Acyl-CoA thioesterase n=1 Tax=Pontixanthobacter aquaemixtae TaxID=1958940 RepID=A0A844ZTR8_9SPHN|nr:thioesterase family protein [Pontixanthobacter aquaemixtae]MXO91265.1 acyl-CoA thioesterase [Pontixanthobacter aquaemixtae]
MTKPFTYRFKVRYPEIDTQGVVFNARYLDYADLVVSEYWNDRQIRVSGEGALEFHVAHAEVDFRKPIRANEVIEGRARTTRFGNSSMTTRIELHGAGPDVDAAGDDLRAEIELVNVHVSLETGKSPPIPDSVRKALSE